MTMMQQKHPKQFNQKGDYKMSSSSSTNCNFDNEASIRDEIKQEPIYDFSPLVEDESGQSEMRKLVNKLGGTYCSGKPLSLSTRKQIVAMAETGMKACDISRQLQISHGCVSKIIAKWRSTGSFEPRRIGGSKPKKTIGDVVAAVRIYKRSCPSIRSLEIRRRLLEEGVCNECNVPSLSSINRIIRMKLRDDLAEFEATAVRELMAILVTTTAPTSEIQEHISRRMKLPNLPNFAMQSDDEPIVQSRELHSQYQFPATYNDTNSQISETQQLAPSTPFNYNNQVHFEAKMQSPPVPPQSFALTPEPLDEKMSFNAIPKMRANRNSSTASSTSSMGSSCCTDASFEIPWNDDLPSNASPSSDEHDEIYSTLFENSSVMPNLHFEEDELWSLLHEMS